MKRSPNSKNTLQKSLIKATLRQNAKTVKHLLSFGIDPNLYYEKRTLLSHAIIGGNLSVVKALVTAGARSDLYDLIDGHHPVSLAIKKNSILLLDILSHSKNFNKAIHMSCQGWQNYTALTYAIEMNDHLFLVKFLLDAHANPNRGSIKTQDRYSSPIEYAVLKNQLDLFKLLIDYKVNISHASFLSIIKTNQIPMLKVLRAAGAQFTSEHMYHAGLYASIETIQYLFDEGAACSLNLKDNTSLHAAIKYSRLDVVQFLLNKIPKEILNAKSPGWGSALHVAVERRYLREDVPSIQDNNTDIEILKLLIKAELNINSKNIDGQTPLHLAVKSLTPEFVELLINAKADSSCQDNYHKTAEDYLLEQKNTETKRKMIGIFQEKSRKDRVYSIAQGFFKPDSSLSHLSSLKSDIADRNTVKLLFSFAGLSNKSFKTWDETEENQSRQACSHKIK